MNEGRADETFVWSEILELAVHSHQQHDHEGAAQQHALRADRVACHDEGAPSSTLHADKIVIIARDKNTPALGAHEPADAREAGYRAARLSDFEANRGPWPLLLVTQLAALHDA